MSKEEEEDSRVEEASLLDIRANWSVDGSEERTVEERAEGFKTVVGGDHVKSVGKGGGEF